MLSYVFMLPHHRNCNIETLCLLKLIAFKTPGVRHSLGCP